MTGVRTAPVTTAVAFAEVVGSPTDTGEKEVEKPADREEGTLAAIALRDDSPGQVRDGHEHAEVSGDHPEESSAADWISWMESLAVDALMALSGEKLDLSTSSGY